MALTLVTAPAAEPVTVAEAKAHLRVDLDDDDALIGRLITAARQGGEDFTGRSFVTQAWRLTLDRVPGTSLSWWDGWREGAAVDGCPNAISLPRPPLQSVSAVTLFGEDGATTEWAAANYFVDGDGGRLVLCDGSAWPTLVRTVAGLSVTYVAGYGDEASDVPAALRQAVLAHVAALYEHRGDDRMPAAAQALYRPYRLVRL
ncbi:MAG: hypothetical protein CMM50_18655 [Rhodospirillaceae bacterium]|nr:hypothetical protein [Rhodospirillaceae bacterium]